MLFSVSVQVSQKRSEKTIGFGKMKQQIYPLSLPYGKHMQCIWYLSNLVFGIIKYNPLLRIIIQRFAV